MINDHDKSFAS